MKDFTKCVPDFKIDGNAWIHRNNHNGNEAWKLLGFHEDGSFSDPYGKGKYYISVGCKSRKLSFDLYQRISNSSKEERWNVFEDVCKNQLYDGEKPRYRYSLWRFLFEFQKEDIILVPGRYGVFHVFRIISANVIPRNDLIKSFPEITNDTEHDFHYFWEVEPVRVNMERYSLAKASLISRMKIRGTTSKLSNKDDLEKAITTETRISIQSEVIDALNTATTHEEMICQLMTALQQTLDDTKFEKLIKWYLKQKRADSSERLSKRKPNWKNGLQDADVEAVFEDLRLKIYVQAKKHDKKVDLETALKQISEYKRDNDEAGYTCLYWVIYSSLDEHQAEQYDAEKYEDIRVISGHEFAEMLLNVGLSDLDDAFYPQKNQP